MEPELSPRVAALEVGVRSLSGEVESVKGSVDRLASNVVAGFSEMRRDLANSGKTNWGWIIASIGVVIAIITAIGSSWVRPLQQTDVYLTERTRSVEVDARESRERIARLEERLTVYRELGIFPTPEKR